MSTIKVKPWGKDQGDHVIINESDFDESIHEKYVEQVIDLAQEIKEEKPAEKTFEKPHHKR